MIATLVVGVVVTVVIPGFVVAVVCVVSCSIVPCSGFNVVGVAVAGDVNSGFTVVLVV